MKRPKSRRVIQPVQQDRCIQNGVLRSLITLCAVVVGAFSIAHASAMVSQIAKPDLALTLVPNHATALATKADYLFVKDNGKPDWREIRRLALASLEGQALNPRAMRLLGLASTAEGKKPLGRSQMAMAAQISRRDLPTQLWFTQQCAESSDFRCVMRHLDVALTTRSAGFALLFPIIREGLGDAKFQQAMAPYLREGRPWMAKFIFDSANTDKVVELSRAMQAAGTMPDDPEYQASARFVVQRLGETGNYAELPRLAPLFGKQVAAATRGLGFAPANIDQQLVPLSWELVTDPVAISGFEQKPGGRGYALAARVDADKSAVVARKILFVQPGLYRADIRGEVDPNAKNALASMTVSCLSGGEPTAIGTVPFARNKARAASEIVRIDTACRVQAVEIRLSGGSAYDGATISVDQVGLVKLSGNAKDARSDVGDPAAVDRPGRIDLQSTGM